MRADRLFIPAKYLVLVLFSFVMAVSCKDDDDDEDTLPSVEGDLYYYMPMYAKINSTHTLVASGVTSPDSVKYVWASTALLPEDTVSAQSCQIVVPDSLGIFTMVLTVSADGYYSRTATRYITSIDTEWDGSIQNKEVPSHTFTDSRDGTEYGYEIIGDAMWLTDNVRWRGAGAAYAKSDDFDELMGRLYTWEEATGGIDGDGLFGGPQGVCPPGWTVPTNEDWVYLANQLGGEGSDYGFLDSWEGLGAMVMSRATFNGEKVWPYDPDCNPENKFNWEAYPAGRAFNGYDNFTALFEYGYWWSASDYTDNQAYYRYIYYENPNFPVGVVGKGDFGASVRCVRAAN